MVPTFFHRFPGFFKPYAVVYVLLIGGLEHEFYFSIYWECHHPNWRTPSFFRGVGIPPTSYWSTSKISNCSNRKGTYPTGLWKTNLLLWYIQHFFPFDEGNQWWNMASLVSTQELKLWLRQAFLALRDKMGEKMGVYPLVNMQKAIENGYL